jgi:predicted nucleotidyltransferase component of viral defense system
MEGKSMISRSELQRLANREKVALGVLEKDYVLTETLKALSRVPSLSNLLVFKGGTALRKVYFSDWRYSEDLDFTAKHDMVKDELQQSLNEWYSQIEQTTQIRLTTRMLHKPNGYARVRSQFIGPLDYPGMIFMDLTFDEPLCLEPEMRTILSMPFPSEGQKVLAYPLEELLAEKLRSLIERGKSRDYYDVWRLLKEKSSELDLKLLVQVLFKKLEHKQLSVNGIDDFLPKDIVTLEKYWRIELEQQIFQIPSFDIVLKDLRGILEKSIAPFLNPSPNNDQ